MKTPERTRDTQSKPQNKLGWRHLFRKCCVKNHHFPCGLIQSQAFREEKKEKKAKLRNHYWQLKNYSGTNIEHFWLSLSSVHWKQRFIWISREIFLTGPKSDSGIVLGNLLTGLEVSLMGDIEYDRKVYIARYLDIQRQLLPCGSSRRLLHEYLTRYNTRRTLFKAIQSRRLLISTHFFFSNIFY